MATPSGGPARRGTWVVAGVVVVAILIGGALAFEEGLAKMTGSGGESIAVVKVLFDGVDAPSGLVYYLAEVNASNSGSRTWHFETSFLSAVSNTSASYPPASGYNVTAQLGATDLAQGEHSVGFVAFELPAGQRLAKLAYLDPEGGVSLQAGEVPAVSGVATRFDPSVHFVLSGTSWAGTIETWAAITNQSSGLAFFGGEASYRNNTFVFFTGQKIGVTFFFDYFKRPMDPATIYVQSVTNDDGLAVSDVVGLRTTFGFAGYSQQPLPVNMTGYGANASVDLLVTVPSGHVSGVLHFTVQFSG